MKEFIIVGRGLAANVLAHYFNSHHITFTLIGDTELSLSSKIAGGLWNPVVFKRMTKSWMADELIAELERFYSNCEEKSGKKIMHLRGIAKSFVEQQEKNLWLKKSKNELNQFLDEIIKTGNDPDLENCKVEAEYGLVKQSGYIDMTAFLESSHNLFKEHTINEIFDYNALNIYLDYVKYREISAQNIIFCEGYLVKNNPYFKWIPLKPAKGETFTISTPQLKLNNTIFNRNGFILRLNSGKFKVGATYEWQDMDQTPSENGKSELIKKLNTLINCNYTIEAHHAGIRPSSTDRRPIIGAHPQYKNLFVFNGLGTKGVMLAPYFANNFVYFYLQNHEIVPEAHVKRFYTLYEEWQKK